MSRWPHDLSVADADALARKWAAGAIQSPGERARQVRRTDELADLITDMSDLYPVRAQALDYMQDKGLRELTVDLDPAIVRQFQCEEDCRRMVVAKAAVIDLAHATQVALYRECLRSSCSSSEAGSLTPEDGSAHTERVPDPAPRTKHSLPGSPSARSPRKSKAPDSPE
jgi:hypothetical protein